MRILGISLFAALSVPIALGQTVAPPLSTSEAARHAGENRTVCGDIVNMYTATSSHGTPTFVDLDQPYPHAIFDLVIWGDSRDNIGQFPEKGRVCASGPIILYRGRPEILLRDWHSWYVPSESRSSLP